MIHEESSADTAVAVYRVKYESGEVKYWMDKLYREDRIWKVAPENARSVALGE